MRQELRYAWEFREGRKIEACLRQDLRYGFAISGIISDLGYIHRGIEAYLLQEGMRMASNTCLWGMHQILKVYPNAIRVIHQVKFEVCLSSKLRYSNLPGCFLWKDLLARSVCSGEIKITQFQLVIENHLHHTST